MYILDDVRRALRYIVHSSLLVQASVELADASNLINTCNSIIRSSGIIVMSAFEVIAAAT
jgi:aminoglycoside N3'-acetyltransferase